ncbi:hypothetical protein [Streptomyces sp. NPDC060027]|uniref:hypothetical protein n=1 Tax=Streptomyces sp. NPDC060027 TaxID=3347040 RepID=UPI0036A140FE
MSTRAAIVEFLNAGYSDRAIARQVHVRTDTVGEIRARLELPVHKPGPSRSTHEDLFWRRAVPTVDGHLLWPYSTTALRVGHEGPRRSAYRIAFAIRWQREPVGSVKPGCGVARCVHPRHVEDQQMREQYAAIFGEVAA